MDVSKPRVKLFLNVVCLVFACRCVAVCSCLYEDSERSPGSWVCMSEDQHSAMHRILADIACRDQQLVLELRHVCNVHGSTNPANAMFHKGVIDDLLCSIFRFLLTPLGDVVVLFQTVQAHWIHRHCHMTC